MKTSAQLVILTGAGISAESGIPTFRASDGLWEQHKVEDVATPEAFVRHPALVQQFYNARRAKLAEVEPNPAHRAIARLQREWPGKVTLITQNIDNLHERGGSEQVLHMHGELLKVRCVKKGTVYPWSGPVSAADACSCCQPAQALRPHIVWFGEMPFYMEDIYQALQQADLFMSVGTSGHVYPAAGFVAEAWRVGAKTLEFNVEPSVQQTYFQHCICGPAGETLPAWVDSILEAPDAWQERWIQG